MARLFYKVVFIPKQLPLLKLIVYCRCCSLQESYRNSQTVQLLNLSVTIVALLVQVEALFPLAGIHFMSCRNASCLDICTSAHLDNWTHGDVHTIYCLHIKICFNWPYTTPNIVVGTHIDALRTTHKKNDLLCTVLETVIPKLTQKVSKPAHLLTAYLLHFFFI